ncbi:TIGR02530 family flagellar biosynthesis protein [Anaerovorax odorimutans]|uniref:TIGR02530 family flagellar biosynthesis protein n=1 Tax=Anaerovorax odorimutans TaxID=109327 RepID=UPI0003F717FB|nr:TIGR02530 family flagellar biosynthesis protein [Anaerovorax odorimutans]
MADIRIGNNYSNNINSISTKEVKRPINQNAIGSDFERILKEQLDKNSKVQFSKHAQQRVNQRGIELTPTLLNDLNNAVSKARDKGAKDVVIIDSNYAFIVNVPNNTVVTTMAGNEMKENVFTNIDSAVII